MTMLFKLVNDKAWRSVGSIRNEKVIFIPT